MEDENDGVLPFRTPTKKWRTNYICLQKDDQHCPNAHLPQQPFPGTQKKLRQNVFQKNGDTLQHTRCQKEEIRYLRRQFSLNGYPNLFKQETLQKRTTDTTVERPSLWQAIPYIANTSEAVARLLKPYGAGVAHRPKGTMSSRRIRIKDRAGPSK